MIKPIALCLTALILSGCLMPRPTDIHDAPAATLPSLSGSEWGFNDASDRFVSFGADGRINGSGGCNRFFGAYMQDGDAVKIGPLASTKKMCAPKTMSKEISFMRALEKVERIEATHIALILRSDNGTTLLSLQRRDWD